MKTKLLMSVSITALTVFVAAESFSQSYYSFGNSIYGSDGYSSYSIGNSTYGNDGYSTYSIGNSIYGSDGRSCYTIGNSAYCN